MAFTDTVRARSVSLGLSLVLVGSIFLFSQFYEHKAIAFFSASLRDASVTEEVRVGGVVYRVVNGVVYSGGVRVPPRSAVLRVAYAKASARANPFFALAGTDPKKLEDAVRALREEASALGTLQSTRQRASLVKNNLYPLSFLHELASLEEARLLFLAQGDEEQGVSYQKHLSRTLRAYRTDLARFTYGFKTLPTTIRPYATDTKIVSREGGLDALSALSDGVHETTRAMEARAGCLSGIFVWCTKNDLLPPSLVIPDRVTVSPETVARAVTIRDMLLSTKKIGEEPNPLVLLSESACVRDARPLLFVGDTDEKNFPSYVGDIRLLPTEKFQNTPFFKYFFERAILYVPHTPLVYYSCPEIGKDIGAIFSTLAVRAFVEEHPLSAEGTQNAHAFARLETSLTSSRMVKESDAREYLVLAQEETRHSPLSEKLRNDIVSLSLQVSNRSTSFDVLVSRIVFIEHARGHLEEEGIQVGKDANELFLARSAFPSLFLGSNLSVFSTPPDFFIKNTLADREQPEIFFSTLSPTGKIREEVVKGIRAFAHLYAE